MFEHPYWWDTVPALRLRPEGAGTMTPPVAGGERATDERYNGSQESAIEPGSRFDVVIVGAGYTGLAAGRHLARARLPGAVAGGGRPRWAPGRPGRLV